MTTEVCPVELIDWQDNITVLIDYKVEIKNNDYDDENGNYERVWISILDKAVPSPEANCEDLLKGVTVTMSQHWRECWPLAEIEKRGPVGSSLLL